MDINFLALIPGAPASWWTVLACAIFSMILGSLWYGPLLGKAWMNIVGTDTLSDAQRKKMQKEAGPLYFVQFALTFFQVSVIAAMLHVWEQLLGTDIPLTLSVARAALLWAVFIMPTIAGSSMWTAEPGNIKWQRFLIQAGYQLVLFVGFGFILGIW